MDEFDFTGFDGGDGIVYDGVGDGSGGADIMGGGWNAAQFLPIAASSFGGVGGFQQIASNQSSGVISSLGTAAAGAAISLGAKLAGMFGRGAGKAAINGVKFSMSALWPYIRKFGPVSVAAALGITLEQLGALAMAAPQQKRKRRRGISAADISRAKRVIRFNRRLSQQLGTNRGRSRGRYYPAPRGRHAHYFN